MKDILSYGIGTLVAFVVIGALMSLFISDITQKKHGVLRNYPIMAGTCATSSSSWESISVSTSSPATATRCPSTAPREHGCTVWRRTRAGSSDSARPSTCMNQAR